jgi:hypothetical protein
MVIHQVVVSEETRHEIDPVRGIQIRKEQVLKQGSSATIQDPEHGTFLRDKHGSFDVPDELGEQLCKQPGWYVGPNPFGEVVAEAKKARATKTRAKAHA